MAPESNIGRIRVLDPRAESTGARVDRASRPSGLQGKTIGLLDNGKINAVKVLHRLGDLLKREAGLEGVLFLSKSDATRPAPAHLIDELAWRCDAVVVGVGD